MHADDRVDADRPAGPRSDRLRFGAAAEAAYHAFCERRGFELISADGSAEPDGEHRGTWAWAWWASPQRWRAGGGTGGTSLDAELTAAAAAVRDNPGRPIAVTFDCRNVVAAARGALATARTRGAARRLREAVEARGSHEPVVWLPLSSSSMSVRQWHTDDLASWACHAAKAGRLGPWSPSEPLPMFPERARRRHPRSR